MRLGFCFGVLFCRSKSSGTVCTSNSSCFLQRRKPMNPLMYPLRPGFVKTTASTVRQRVMSAKLLKMRSIQNQLNDANYHLTELSKENQALKNMQKRQDKALTKYTNEDEDLPRLLHAHQEQLRTLIEKNKILKKNVKELSDILKTKEEELLKTQEKLNHLERLNRDKHLVNREKLMDQLEDLKLKLQKSGDQVAILNRKLMLESKTSKQKVNAEILKHKQCKKQLEQALIEIDRLTRILEAKESAVTCPQPRKNRFTRIPQPHSVSMVTLGGKFPEEDIIEEEQIKNPVTDIKLQPIKCNKKVEEPKKSNGILNMPSENIRNRLSSAHSKVSDQDSSSMTRLADNFLASEGSLDCGNSASSIDSKDMALTTFQENTAMKPALKDIKCDSDEDDTNLKLNVISKTLNEAIKKATKNSNEDFDSKLGHYCTDIVKNIRNCSDTIENHKTNLNFAKEDTKNLVETFKKTQKMESRLKQSLLDFKDNDMDCINEILSEELKFKRRQSAEEQLLSVANEKKEKLEEKRRLLATLRAIDSENDIDRVEVQPRASNYMQELLKDFSK